MAKTPKTDKPIPEDILDAEDKCNGAFSAPEKLLKNKKARTYSQEHQERSINIPSEKVVNLD